MFRFTIRDVLWLMVVVALAVGWFVRESMFAAELDRQRGEYEYLRQHFDAFKEAVDSGEYPP
jgi:hypothetical protein